MTEKAFLLRAEQFIPTTFRHSGPDDPWAWLAHHWYANARPCTTAKLFAQPLRHRLASFVFSQAFEHLPLTIVRAD